MEVKATTLTRAKLLALLSRLQGSTQDYITIYATPTSSPGDVAGPLIDGVPWAGGLPGMLCSEGVVRELERYRTGLVAFWSEAEHGLIIIPPFAIPHDQGFRGEAATSPLHRLLCEDRLIGVVLVTWGSYAVGLVRGDMLLESKTGTGHIHKRHHKGGRSQKRFARRTEEQKRDFLRRVANRVDERFAGRQLDQLFFGGNRLILKPLIDESSYLRHNVGRVSHRVLGARSARRDVLLRSPEDVYRSVVFETACL